MADDRALYRDYTVRDYENGGALIFGVTYQEEMFTLEVQNEKGKPIRLVLTEKNFKQDSGE